ncbi:MAG: DUF4132 domain-containing protein [Myxococcales bacterium]|nr:DUF4132 domain-containing protein [Myxococcales bacterium]
MPRYEFVEGTSSKFWQIDLNGPSFTTTFGRIGSSGQTSTKSFATDAKAQAEYDKLIAEKTKKGYQLVSGGSPPAPATSAAPVAAATPAATAPTPAAPVRSATPKAPKATSVEASAAPPVEAPAPPVPGSGPTVVMTDAAQRAAEKELAVFRVKPSRAEDAAGTSFPRVQEAFEKHIQPFVSRGLAHTSGDSARWSHAVLTQYGAPTLPTTLEVEAAAAVLQFFDWKGVRRGATPTSPDLVNLWVAHAGLGFAVEAFVTSLGDRQVVTDTLGTATWLADAPARPLENLFGYDTDRAIAESWLGATEAQRVAGRAHAEKLRAQGTLLQRSAIASCVLDPAWIDADLREHATTGERAMFSIEALLRATSASDLEAYFEKLSEADREYYLPKSRWLRASARDDGIEGYAFVQRLGLGGIDVACTRIATLLPQFSPDPYHGARVGELLRSLFEVARLAHEAPRVVDAAIAVLEKAGDEKIGKDSDPRPAAYDCLRSSPNLALQRLRDVRQKWAKNLLPQLERLVSGGASDDRADAELGALPAFLQKNAAFKAPDFWQPAALPRIVLRDGTLLPIAVLGTLAAALKADDPAPIAELQRVAEPASLAAFGWDLFQAWLLGGANSKEKWAFTALGRLGNDDTARRLTPLVRAWPGESQHARAVLGLDVLGAIGSDVALMMLNGIAQKVKFKGLQERARERMDEIASKRGMSAEQLADRLVPDLDLEDDGSKTLDFGPRSFRVGFDETLSPFVVDATGARLKDLPKPNSKDDPTLGAEATEVWKAMKKDVRALASIQIVRLELGMGNARRWTGEEFRNFFVDHPLLTHLVRRLVWGVYDDGKLARTFRVAEDRTFADAGDDACDVDPTAAVGIVHRLHLTDVEATAWSTVFADYELAQPFEQLSRATYRLAPDEAGATALTRFAGRVVETKKILGLLSRGWRKGPPQDAGCIFEVYKPIRSDLIASLPFEMGLNAGGMDYVDPTQKLGVVDFAPSIPDWGRSRPDLVPLASLDEVIVSEVIRDIESMGQVTT